MEIAWKVSASDVRYVREFVRARRSNAFVKHRIAKNVRGRGVRVSKEVFWQFLVTALVTTQQRSGPGTPVSRLLYTKPFSLALQRCIRSRNPERLAHRELSRCQLRRSTRIAGELAENLRRLESGLWRRISPRLRELRSHRGPSKERRAATLLMDTLAGIGPKQSRNLLQGMGLTRYEIPLDSRIVKWLNAFGYPVALSATALADAGYYQFAVDGVQQLCARARIVPCVLDAAIFASYDGDKWEDVHLE